MCAYRKQPPAASVASRAYRLGITERLELGTKIMHLNFLHFVPDL